MCIRDRSLDATCVSAYYLRGQLFRTLGDEQSFLKDYRQAIELEATHEGDIDADDKHAWYARGLAHFYVGDSKAIADLEKAAQLSQSQQDLAFREKVFVTLQKLQQSEES